MLYGFRKRLPLVNESDIQNHHAIGGRGSFAAIVRTFDTGTLVPYIVDRRKILLAVQRWHASIAIALAIWATLFERSASCLVSSWTLSTKKAVSDRSVPHGLLSGLVRSRREEEWVARPDA
jgi:hypothetical protein